MIGSAPSSAPARHSPASHSPASHSPASHSPASHSAASHSAASHSAASHSAASHSAAPRRSSKPAHHSVGREPVAPFTFRTDAMGGRLAIHLAGVADPDRARRDAIRVASRIKRWARPLTRHDPQSELSRLNRASTAMVVGPTLTAAIVAGRFMGEETGGLVDIALLDERLAAEGLTAGTEAHRPVPTSAAWTIATRSRRRAIVDRDESVRFDLDGVGKGWLADRALALVDAWPNAVVDADGDLAIKAAPGEVWEIAVDDPRAESASIAILRLAAPDNLPRTWGVATSGVSVHRWVIDGRPTHHLIDPRTGRPATTDVLQATVVAGSALRAEALAKAVVIAGIADGFALLEQARAIGAVAVLRDGSVVAIPSTLSILAT